MHPRIPARSACATTIFAAWLALTASAGTAAPAGEAGGPDASAQMEALLDRLATRAEQYRRYALGFTCEELLIRSLYDPLQGTFRRRDREVYDYLFERSAKSGRLGEVRELILENGKPVRRSVRYLSLDIPPSYAWSQIFARENRGKFHFKPAGKVLKGYRLLIQIDFVGAAAEPGKDDIAGWSGRASVDSGTLNLHLIEAEPSGQSARLEAERLKYQRAFSIMGVPLAERPKSRAVHVVFGYDNEGLTYPTETTVVRSVYVRTGEQGLEEKAVLRYRAYRFFKVGAEETEARPEASADPNAPVGPPPPSETPEPQPSADPNAPHR